ncbi:OprO/OprP family phosphate-selective porin [Terricaulis sp.]|uniref:OprO/OprP family phosphate-selective porin n=1 Tax=Terricaulis sp. TaxID=2768686 RepID=UPI002AC40CCF|nr:porin [Terricaulis sp.]MDZ4692901.1 porin [Terricaulis sp.]
MKKNLLTKAALAVLATAAGATAAHAQSAPAAPAPTHSTSWTGTVGEDRFGDARFKMRGRFQYDVLSSELDFGGLPTTDENGTRSYVRRAFLGVQGRLTENWRYKVDFILAPSATSITVDDAFLEYVGDDWSLVIGEHNITSPLEDRISSLDIPFMERSSIYSVAGFGRRAGVGVIFGGANWSASGAVQGDSVNSAETSFANNEELNVSGRFTFAPIFETSPEGTQLLHFGVSARQRNAGGTQAFTYEARPLNGRGGRPLSVSGVGDGGESDTTYGVELAGQYGPFGLTAEYIVLNGETLTNGEEFEYSGYYVDLSWSLTGESRSYRGNQGSFGAIVPRRPLGTDGGYGHLALAGRYDYIDMTDAGIGLATDTLGEQTAYAIGLDWIPVDHVRFKLNYAHSEIDYANPGDGADGEATIISLRSQFDF